MSETIGDVVRRLMAKRTGDGPTQSYWDHPGWLTHDIYAGAVRIDQMQAELKRTMGVLLSILTKDSPYVIAWAREVRPVLGVSHDYPGNGFAWSFDGTAAMSHIGGRSTEFRFQSGGYTYSTPSRNESWKDFDFRHVQKAHQTFPRLVKRLLERFPHLKDDLEYFVRAAATTSGTTEVTVVLPERKE